MLSIYHKCVLWTQAMSAPTVEHIRLLVRYKLVLTRVEINEGGISIFLKLGTKNYSNGCH
jgi:hypothetical protein